MISETLGADLKHELVQEVVKVLGVDPALLGTETPHDVVEDDARSGKCGDDGDAVTLGLQRNTSRLSRYRVPLALAHFVKVVALLVDIDELAPADEKIGHLPGELTPLRERVLCIPRRWDRIGVLPRDLEGLECLADRRLLHDDVELFLQPLF